jgi:hypothetical protein
MASLGDDAGRGARSQREHDGRAVPTARAACAVALVDTSLVQDNVSALGRGRRRIAALVAAAAIAAGSGLLADHLSTDATGARKAPTISAGRLTYLAMDFAGSRDGAVLDSVAPAKGPGRCALAIYGTVDGATRWSGPLVFDNGAPCLDDLAWGSESLSVTSASAWWLVIGGRLYAGTLVGQMARAVSLPDGAQACSVAASGSSVYVAVGLTCSYPAGLLLSTDVGRTWAEVRTLPVSLVASPAFGQVELTGARSVVAIGRPKSAGTSTTPARKGPLAIAQKEGDGPWRSNLLPCKAGQYKGIMWYQGLVTSSGHEVVAACLAGAAASSQAIEVLTSDDGGRNWSERCGNGFFGLANKMGSCPGYGMPTGIAIGSGGGLVMALDNLGLLASSDGGAKWHSVPSPAAELPEVELSSSGGVMWAFETGPSPVTAGGWLAESTNGTTWHRVTLPSK